MNQVQRRCEEREREERALRDEFNAHQAFYILAGLQWPYLSFEKFRQARLSAEKWSKAMGDLPTRHFHDGFEFVPSTWACPACGTRLHHCSDTNANADKFWNANRVLVICLNADCESEAAGIASPSRVSAEDAAQKLYQAVTAERNQ